MSKQTNTQSAASPALSPNNIESDAEPLTENNRQEALEFLSLRPVHTVILAGWMRDHGIESPLHRGSFYGYRDVNGDLAGVAMIGRNLLFEASTEDAVVAFARCARKVPDVRMIFAEEDKLSTFWTHLRGKSSMPKVSRHKLITSGGVVSNDVEIIDELRMAANDELDQIVAAHAEMVFAATGVDPLVADAVGFRTRCGERVDQGRVCVWLNGGELIFKTDIVSVTPEAIYIEGLWVNPKARGNGYSTQCLASMCRQLLSGSNTICGFVDVEHELYNSLYRKAGFTEVDEFAKIYL